MEEQPPFVPLQPDNMLHRLQQKTRYLSKLMNGKQYQMDVHHETPNYIYEIEMQQRLNYRINDLGRIQHYGNDVQSHQYKAIPENVVSLHVKPVRQLIILNSSIGEREVPIFVSNLTTEVFNIKAHIDYSMQRVFVVLPFFKKKLLIDDIEPITQENRRKLLENDVQGNNRYCTRLSDFCIYFIKNSHLISKK